MILKLAEDKDIKGLLKLGSIIIVQYLILSFVIIFIGLFLCHYTGFMMNLFVMFSIPILLLCEKLLPEKVSMYIFNVLIKVISIVFIVLLILTPIWNIKYKTVIDLKNNRLNTFEIYSPLYKFEDNTVNYDTTGPKSVFYYYMAQGVALKKYSNINSYIFNGIGNNEIIENEDRVELVINCINNNDYIYCSDRDLEYRLNNYLSLK